MHSDGLCGACAADLEALVARRIILNDNLMLTLEAIDLATSEIDAMLDGVQHGAIG